MMTPLAKPAAHRLSEGVFPAGVAYLLDADNLMEGPYPSFADAVTTVFGDLPGIRQFALNALGAVALIRAQDCWHIIGDLRMLEARRADHIAAFLKVGSRTPKRVRLEPIGEEICLEIDDDQIEGAIDILQARHVPMRIRSLSLDDLTENKICADLVNAWVTDDKQCGRMVNEMINLYALRNTMISLTTRDWRFTWAGPGLVFLDSEPDRLFGRPVDTLGDKQFVEGIMVDLIKATSQPRPTISKVITPLNNRIVEYNILSLPDWDIRNNTISSCTRIPVDLIVYGQKPDRFDLSASVPNTVFSTNPPPLNNEDFHQIIRDRDLHREEGVVQ